MLALAWIILILVGLSAPGVVLTRDPLKQCIAVSFYGLLLALTFFIFQAPDVALSQITIGAAILPAIILLALVKMRRQNQLRGRRGAGK
ncbi:MAG: Na(+)/H(+) antiporter subunit B [Ktedonobacterales bacterium]